MSRTARFTAPTSTPCAAATSSRRQRVPECGSTVHTIAAATTPGGWPASTSQPWLRHQTLRQRTTTGSPRRSTSTSQRRHATSSGRGRGRGGRGSGERGGGEGGGWRGGGEGCVKKAR